MKYTMNVFFSLSGNLVRSLPRNFLPKRLVASQTEKSKKDKIDLESLEGESILLDPEPVLLEEEVEAKKNKSRLRTAHRNVLKNLPPMGMNLYHYEDTVKYKRRLLGRYGMDAVNVPIGVAWPTQREVEESKAYESTMYPETLTQMWEKISVQNVTKAKLRRERDAQVSQNMQKLDKWKADLASKIAKKDAELTAARERKERLVEEVRRHFGFKIDSRDQRFKDMLEQKEKEEKRMKKMAKKQAREAKMLAYLQKQQTEVKDNAIEQTGITKTS